MRPSRANRTIVSLMVAVMGLLAYLGLSEKTIDHATAAFPIEDRAKRSSLVQEPGIEARIRTPPDLEPRSTLDAVEGRDLNSGVGAQRSEVEGATPDRNLQQTEPAEHEQSSPPLSASDPALDQKSADERWHNEWLKKTKENILRQQGLLPP